MTASYRISGLKLRISATEKSISARYGPGVLSDKPCVRVKEIDDDKHKLVRIARPVTFNKGNMILSAPATPKFIYTYPNDFKPLP